MVFGFGKKSEKSELEHASPGDTVVGLPPSPPDVVDGNVPAKKQGGTFMDTESVVSDVTLVAQQEGLKPTFVAKCNVINRALAEIGMGKYQWELFFAGGFGWFADNICELHSSVWVWRSGGAGGAEGRRGDKIAILVPPGWPGWHTRPGSVILVNRVCLAEMGAHVMPWSPHAVRGCLVRAPRVPRSREQAQWNTIAVQVTHFTWAPPPRPPTQPPSPRFTCCRLYHSDVTRHPSTILGSYT
jgi:hypothetical protein